MSQRVPHPQTIYFDRVERLLRPGLHWLDVGCGRQLAPDWLAEHRYIEARLKAHGAFLVGVDLDLASLRRNGACAHRLLGSAAALPFAAGSFDLVTSNMVFEHLRRPLAALTEIHRVLRPGGRVIIHTPNAFGLASIGARIIPNRWHPFIVRRIDGRAEEDVHPTHFAFNRRREVERLLRTAGFTGARIEHLDCPSFYQRVPLVGLIEAIWVRLARRMPVLRPTLLIEAGRGLEAGR